MDIKDVIKEYVLPFLPAKSLVRFKTVCKDWNQWISSPFLAHKQTNYFRDISGLFCQFTDRNPSFISLNPIAYGISSRFLEFLPEPVDIIASCNGLLCCQGHHGDSAYYICNPVNKEWEVLPQPKYYHGSNPTIVLAFEPSTLNFAANYELICAIPLLDHQVVLFEIYCSTKRSWRLSEAECCERNPLILNNNSGFYMKGIAYWETSSHEVLAFDLKNEHYGILPLPSNSGPHGVLTEMHGELCYIQVHNQTGNEYVINIYGDTDMTLMHSIFLNPEVVGNIFGECRALPCVNSDVLIILVGEMVISYHVKDQKVELLSRMGNDCNAKYLPYVNSLVSRTENQENASSLLHHVN